MFVHVWLCLFYAHVDIQLYKEALGVFCGYFQTIVLPKMISVTALYAIDAIHYCLMCWIQCGGN